MLLKKQLNFWRKKRVIKIRHESDLRNWFKKNYKLLGIDKIIKSNTKKFPDFLVMEKGKKIKVELETRSSNFILHNHPVGKNIKVVCIIEDKKLKVPTIKIEKLALSSSIKNASKYSFREQVFQALKKSKERIFTTSEVAYLLGINWGTAEKALLELLVIKKVDRIKKEGVNLWMKKNGR